MQGSQLPPPPKVGTWREDSKLIARWIERHPIILGALAFLLPSTGLYHFATIGRVPLEIASSDIIAALPLLLGRITFIVVVLSALPILPALLMFEGAVREPDGRVRVLPSARRARRRKVRQWLLALAIPGFMIAGALIGTVSFGLPDTWVIPLAIAISSSTFAFTIHRIRRTPSKDTMAIDSIALYMAAGVAQMMVALITMQLSLRFVSDSMNQWIVFGILIVATILVAILQVLLIRIIELTSSHAGFVKQAFFGALVAISIAFTFPPSGAALTAAVLRDSASGGNRCVTLELTRDAADFAKLIAPSGVDEAKTVGLSLLSNLGGTYLARKHGSPDDTVHRIPIAKVTGMKACPEDG
ncbi:hypothetical protein EDF74_3559 [Stenotrophomonas rhizophila]|uniref:hypothetical protein n=1 Tax=Stenotrophomonas TaxID=40323 RepID=UPI000FA4D29F|nr:MULTISPECIES: hypothetical protein [Stenotrophomonas]ROP73292.1 hypothetical protein EDF74_3559 [Stenotrophomonas rhizophila]